MKTLNMVSCMALLAFRLGHAGGMQEIGFGSVDEVVAARMELHMAGIADFMEAVYEQGVAAPGIHSKYWVDRFTRGNPAQTALEMAYRDFGFEFLLQVDQLALEVFRAPDSQAEKTRVDRLLRIAEWIARPGKYENYRIAIRTEEAATIPLLRIITDMSVREDEVARLLGRFTASEKSAPVRARILYEESGGAFDVRGCADADALARRWVAAQRKAYSHFGDKMVQYSRASAQLATEKDEYAFFTDDDVSGLKRDSVRWDKKTHKILCVNRGSAMFLKPIKNVFRFRELIGQFPEVHVPVGVRERDAYEKAYGNQYRWKLYDEEITPETVASYYLDSKRNTYVDRQTWTLLDRREVDTYLRQSNIRGSL